MLNLKHFLPVASFDSKAKFSDILSEICEKMFGHSGCRSSELAAATTRIIAQ